MTNTDTNTNSNSNFQPQDLSLRTAKFGMGIVKLAKKLPATDVNIVSRKQFVRSGTSVGANYCEADESLTQREKVHRLGICKKEAKETRFWLFILKEENPRLKDEADVLVKETEELIRIFSKMISNRS
jgi:four helix bundle protein